MPAGGQHVVVGDDYRRRLQIPSAALAQIAYKIVLYSGQVQPDEFEIVLANGTEQVVDFPCLHHTVVTFPTVDGRAARIRQITCQFCVIFFRKPSQHVTHIAHLSSEHLFLPMVHILVYFLLVFLGIGEVVAILILPHLFVHLLAPVGFKMEARERVSELFNLGVIHVFEQIHQIPAGLGQQIGFVAGECAVQQFPFVPDAIVHEQLVQCGILHHSRNVRVAAVGEVVSSLPLVL